MSKSVSLHGVPIPLVPWPDTKNADLTPPVRRALEVLELVRASREVKYDISHAKVQHLLQKQQDRMLQARRASVDVIKAKQAYQRYIATVPKRNRKPSMPQTPPFADPDMPLRRWRWTLSVWDKELRDWHVSTLVLQ